MKLKHVPDKQEMIKHAFKIEKDYSDLIEGYANYVKEMTGTEISSEEVVSSMLKTFLDDDKKFQAWLKAKEKSAQKNDETPIKVDSEKKESNFNPSATQTPSINSLHTHS